MAAVETLLVSGSLTASELGHDLARRLVLAGVAVVAESATDTRHPDAAAE